MILDEYSEYKIYIAMIAASIWIYVRTADCYKLLPRKNIVSIFLVIIWIYLYDKDHLFLPIGLLAMYVNSKSRINFR